MTKILLALSLMFIFPVYSQIITSDNYFQYKSNGKGLKGSLTTAWVNKLEVAKILEEEMENEGFEWISTFKIVKINDNEYVNSICFSEKSKVGFLYEGIHNAFPTVEQRNLKSLFKEMTGNDYSEKIVKLNGDSEFVKFKEVPNNFFILKENSYWYQYTNNIDDNKVLVTKEIILEILRKDIRNILLSFKK